MFRGALRSLVVCAVVLVASAAWGQEIERTRVVFLTGEGDPTAELRLATELALALHDLQVTTVAGPANLDVLPSTMLFATLRPYLDDDVLAAAWLGPDADPLRLSLGFAGEGRGVVRVVEQPAGPGAEAALAVAVREVLAEARVTDEETSVESTPPPSAIRLVGGASLAFGGALGVVPRGTLFVDVEHVLVGRLQIGWGFALRAGGIAEVDSRVVEVGARVRPAFLPGNDVVGAGPYLAAELAWLGVNVERLDGDRAFLSLPMLRFTPGVELRVSPGPVGFSLSVGADLMPLRGLGLRRSDDALVHDTGVVGLTVAAGVRIRTGE